MLLNHHRVKASNACLIDDIAHNLEPAKAMGMTTVWLKGEFEWARPNPDPAVLRHIDFTAENLGVWLDGVLEHLEARPEHLK